MLQKGLEIDADGKFKICDLDFKMVANFLGHGCWKVDMLITMHIHWISELLKTQEKVFHFWVATKNSKVN
jgi:hypothetical protein